MNEFLSTGRAAQWVIRELGLPAIVKACVACRFARHRPTGKFRVNANGKLLDVWMLLHCAVCDRTSKVPVHERVHVSSLEPARRVAYENNNPAVVRELAMSASLAAKNGYRLDWTGAWELETDTTTNALHGLTPLKVLISFELPAPVRVERLLMLGLRLGRTEVRRMVADGRIQLPLAPGAKAHQDFELSIDRRPGSNGPAKRSKRLVAPTRERTDLSQLGSHDVASWVPLSATTGA